MLQTETESSAEKPAHQWSSTKQLDVVTQVFLFISYRHKINHIIWQKNNIIARLSNDVQTAITKMYSVKDFSRNNFTVTVVWMEYLVKSVL